MLAAWACRSAHYTLNEPVESQIIEVKADDRWNIWLDENATTGFRWEAECKSGEVAVRVDHFPAGDARDGICGAPGKARVNLRVLQGFRDLAEVNLRYRRSWSGEVAREVRLMLRRNANDFAFWR